jgi:processive 1,2-diacylglycerol beta-glucosyltransferase
MESVFLADTCKEKNPRGLAKKTIIFAMIEAGGGHKSPAEAVHEALHTLYPNRYSLRILDFMKSTGCTDLDLKHKESWNFLLSHPVLCRSGEIASDLAGPVFQLGLRHYLTPFYSCAYRFVVGERPDLIFSTHPFNSLALDHVRKKYGLRFTLLTYLTELFDASCLWTLKGSDYFLVPTPEAKRKLARRGVSEKRLKVFDYPLRSMFFSKRAPREETIRSLGLEKGKKVLLMSLGGEGSVDLGKFIDTLQKNRIPLNVIAVTGKNESLRKTLSARYGPLRGFVTLKVHGYTERMHELMGAADFCFIKPGPATTMEALALQKPVIFSRPVHQGERTNIQYIVNRGLGFYAGDSPRLFLRAVHALMDSSTEQLIHSRFSTIEVSNGAEKIARFIVKLVEGNQ